MKNYDEIKTLLSQLKQHLNLIDDEELQSLYYNYILQIETLLQQQ